MMKTDDYEIPEGPYYSKEHEWLLVKRDCVVVGTDYTQRALHEIVYVELPPVGSEFKQMETMGTVESVKAVAELYMPVGGRILAVNAALEKSPELVNKDPYGDGWMIEVQPSDPAEFEALMIKDVYLETLKGQA